MDLFVIIFIVIVLWGIRWSHFNEMYIGRETTTSIKGIFAIVILFNHAGQYLPPPIINNWLTGDYRPLFDLVLGFLGQLMVVMFLVYSGYGIMESFKRKRGEYLDGFLRKRVLKTFVHFDIAVGLFLILALTLGHDYSISEILWSFTGWLSIGNSNWFIFDIIVLYLLTYAGLVTVERFGLSEKTFLWLIYGLSLTFLIFMLLAKGNDAWWYDTILSFPTGMLWSVYRERIETACRESKRYWPIFFTTLLAFTSFYIAGQQYKAVFSFIASPLFGLLVILLTMKLRIGNVALHWLGINAFSIYILQRLAMIVATEYGLNTMPVLFMLIVVPTTLLIARTFTACTDRLDRRLFS